MRVTKKLSFALASLVLVGPTLASPEDGRPALIKVDLDRTIGAVDPNIYGSFLEPLGRAFGRGIVYGPLYDPDSPLSDENGFRKDYIRQVRELKVSAIRWPGGNFVSGHHWEDAIGPKGERSATLDLSRHRVESNQMGTDEYVAFSNLVGAENFICINAGTGTIEDAAHWVEYANAPVGTRYADLRAKYGHPEPYGVKYWALGNEPDGPWQLGHKSKEEYARFAIEAAKMMRGADEDILLVAAGSSNYPLVTGHGARRLPSLRELQQRSLRGRSLPGRTAVLNEAAGNLVVNVVNRSETDAIPAELELQSGAYTGKGQVHLVNADSIEATNTATEEQVHIATSDLEFTGNRIRHTFPAHSLTQLEITLQR